MACGGTIICEKFVMTAAHCVQLPSINRITVLAEEHDMEDDDDHKEHEVKTIYIHPKYISKDDTPYDHYDFAILELKKPIDLSSKSKARAACLPDKSDTKFRRGTEFLTSGWGRIDNFEETNILQKVMVPHVKDKDCRKKHGYKELSKSEICAGDKSKRIGSCNGDSGGPLTWYDQKVKKWKLIGVVSHGIMGKDENGQFHSNPWHDPEHPFGCGKVGVYAEVTTVLDWVQSIINGCKGKGKIKGQRLPIRGHDG